MHKQKLQAFLTFDTRDALQAKCKGAVLASYVTFANGWQGELWRFDDDRFATCPDRDDPRWKSAAL